MVDLIIEELVEVELDEEDDIGFNGVKNLVRIKEIDLKVKSGRQ